MSLLLTGRAEGWLLRRIILQCHRHHFWGGGGKGEGDPDGGGGILGLIGFLSNCLIYRSALS